MDEAERKKELKTLRQRRTVRRNQATKDIERTPAPSGEGEPPAIDKLTDHLALMQEHKDRIHEFDDRIQNLILDEDELEKDATDSEEFSILLSAAIAPIKAALQRHQANDMEVSTTNDRDRRQQNRDDRPSKSVRHSTPEKISEEEIPHEPNLTQTVSTRVQRPCDLTPPVFDGNRLRFRAFLQQFENYVERQIDLSPMERLIVLTKHLKGDPLDLIVDLPLNDANYEVALQTLERFYSSKSSDVMKMLDRLRNIPKISNPFDLPALRRLVVMVQQSITALEANGLPLGCYAPAVQCSIEAALPVRMRQEHLRMKRMDLRYGGALPEDREASAHLSMLQDPEAELNRLLEFLQERVEELEETKPPESAERLGPRTGNNERQSSDKRTRDKPQQSTVGATVSTKQGQQKFKPLPCIFCESTEHRSSRCNASMTIHRRREILSAKNRCHLCFRESHAAPTECPGPRSPCVTCKSKSHYSSMHHTGKEVSNAAVTLSAAGCAPPIGTLLWTASAFVVNGGSRIPIRAFIDNGSSLTFVNPILRQMLKERPVGFSNLNLMTLSDTERLQNVPIYSIRLASCDDKHQMELIAYEYNFDVMPPSTGSPSVLQAIRHFHKKHPLADRAYLNEWDSQPPTLLIGMNHLHHLMCRTPPETVTDEILAYETKLGWVIGGPVEPSKPQVTGEVATAHAVCCSIALSAAAKGLSPAADAIQTMWNLDAVGIKDPSSEAACSADEASALEQFASGLSYNNNEYTVRMPRRQTIETLSNNHRLAQRRLTSKLVQLRRDPKVYLRYHEEIMSFVRDGHAREVDTDNETGELETSYVMPHHQVTTPSPAGERWRIVFDCSASEPGSMSLNEHLLPGPNLNPDLVTLLLNFRLHAVALSADISKAYLRIRLHEDDRKLFRYLWQPPGEATPRCFEMCKVIWGARSSGFLLAAVIREHLRRSALPDCDEIGDSIYADDYLCSFPDAKQATQMVERLREVFSSANMEWAKWKTNDKGVESHLIDLGTPPLTGDLANSGVLKVLGVQWMPKQDVIRFIMPDLSDRATRKNSITKRQALAFVASLYDPLGALTPYSIRGKLIIQKLWSRNLQWNENVPAESQEELLEWLSELRSLERLQIPRRFAVGEGTPTAYHLHLFSDASKAACSAAAYLETQFSDGGRTFSLVMTKSRLAPRDAPTLPRLELLAALYAARLKQFLVSRMKVDFAQVSFYTDSTITYHWVTAVNPGAWRPFVCNRVTEIRKFSEPSQWHHVQGDKNIADLATRGISADSLVETEEWWFAPSWLRLPRSDQPISQPRLETPALNSVETELRRVVAASVVMECLIDLARFSTFGKAVRVLSNVLRFINNCRKSQTSQTEDHRRCLARTLLIRSAQAQHLADEIKAAKAGERPHSRSKLAAYNLFIDDEGILRVKTRLRESALLSFEEVNPAVIPSESRIARLLIIDAHRVNAHFGVSTVLAILRRQYWIIRGRQVVKAILNRCTICRKSQSRPAEQIEGPLPALRSNLQTVFFVSGVDFCGPFLTKQRQLTFKTYVAVFSCAATRAIHLEAVPSMTTPQTLLAIRRFIASFPSCKHLISDNGRSFVKSATEIKRVFNTMRERDVQEYLNERAIEWKFQCPNAPWRTGFVERHVGLLKRSLFKSLGRSLIGYEEFRTLLCELTSILNNRPISYVSADPTDLTPITPNHFIRGGPQVDPIAQIVPIDQLRSDEVAAPSDLRKRLAARTTYFKNLSVRWFREYLLLLRSANSTRGSPSTPIKVGDVCLFQEDNKPRIRWELVKVEESHPGRDGNIRSYTVRNAHGHLLKRAAQRLIPLEVTDPIETP